MGETAGRLGEVSGFDKLRFEEQGNFPSCSYGATLKPWCSPDSAVAEAERTHLWVHWTRDIRRTATGRDALSSPCTFDQEEVWEILDSHCRVDLDEFLDMELNMRIIGGCRARLPVVFALAFVQALWAGDTEGRWIKDRLTGIQVWDAEPKESTVISWSGGSESDRASGFGVLSVFVEGKLIGRYTGTMRDGRAKGEGEIIWMEEGERFTYRGGFLDGEPHGLGTMTYQDGSTLESIFVEGEIGDYGVYRGANGEQYDGQLVSGKPDGEGLHLSDTGEIYKGEFAVGRRSGKGELLLPDGTVMSGDFRDNEMNGVGKVVFPDGSVYEGEMQDDKATGKGVLRTPDGTVFSGQFISNQPDGTFKVTKPDGTTSTEVWKMGEKIIW